MQNNDQSRENPNSPYELKKSGIIVPKKKPIKLYEGKDVLHETEQRVKDEYWFDEEVNPLAGLAKEEAKKSGKSPLPPPHVFMSGINMRMRRLITSELRRKHDGMTEGRVREILRQVIVELKELIYDEFELKKDAFDLCLGTAVNFWYRHPLRRNKND